MTKTQTLMPWPYGKGPRRESDRRIPWERFQMKNPQYRPWRITRAGGRPCLAHDIAIDRTYCSCWDRCLTGPGRRTLDELTRHDDRWHVVDDSEHTHHVMVTHHGRDPVECARELEAWLNKLPENIAKELAIHVGRVENGWNEQRTVPVVIQNAQMRAVKDWRRITAATKPEEHRPNQRGNGAPTATFGPGKRAQPRQLQAERVAGRREDRRRLEARQDVRQVPGRRELHRGRRRLRDGASPPRP